MKPVSQEKSHCFKHACAYLQSEPGCPYCLLEKKAKQQELFAHIDRCVEEVIAASEGQS